MVQFHVYDGYGFELGGSGEVGEMDLAAGVGVAEKLEEADEAFVTGTFGGLTPVRSIDGHPMAEALPGPMTVRLRAAYEALKDRDAGR